MTCPLTGGAPLDNDCASCMNYIDSVCQHRQTVNVEGDVAATATLYGVTARAVEARCLRIQRGVAAALFFQHVTGRALEDARPCDIHLATNSSSAYEAWVAPSKEPWPVVREYLALLTNLLTAPFERNLEVQHEQSDTPAAPR